MRVPRRRRAGLTSVPDRTAPLRGVRQPHRTPRRARRTPPGRRPAGSGTSYRRRNRVGGRRRLAAATAARVERGVGASRTSSSSAIAPNAVTDSRSGEGPFGRSGCSRLRIDRCRRVIVRTSRASSSGAKRVDRARWSSSERPHSAATRREPSAAGAPDGASMPADPTGWPRTQPAVGLCLQRDREAAGCDPCSPVQTTMMSSWRLPLDRRPVLYCRLSRRSGIRSPTLSIRTASVAATSDDPTLGGDDGMRTPTRSIVTSFPLRRWWPVLVGARARPGAVWLTLPRSANRAHPGGDRGPDDHLPGHPRAAAQQRSRPRHRSSSSSSCSPGRAT
jgi:hypothetical protein